MCLPATTSILTSIPGEVHTLLGENGAGKSTLMKILYGLYEADEGEVLLNGEPLKIKSPTDAIEHGIGMIHQHFMLVPSLTVAENVALGLKSSRGVLTDLDVVSERIVELGETYGLHVDPSAPIWQMAVGEQQRVEIIKALYRDARLLILDEPTAVLTPQEVDQLFVTLRQLTDDGRGLIFISHKLHEVLALSTRITVLRHGKVTGSVGVEGATRQSLAQMMVGRAVKLAPDKTEAEPGAAALEIRGLRVARDRGGDGVRGLDLDVHRGEIVGVAGVSGNGQMLLAEAIAGLRVPSCRVDQDRGHRGDRQDTTPGSRRRPGLRARETNEGRGNRRLLSRREYAADRPQRVPIPQARSVQLPGHR